MLVLTRKEGQRIVIGRRGADGVPVAEVVLTLIAAGHGRAKIGLEGPEELVIVREEVAEAFGFATPQAVGRPEGAKGG